MSEAAPSPAIDMITFARFAVLPGAERILSAYSKVPPGKLRDAFILQIEALAEQYDDAPAEYRQDDPLAVAARVAAFTAPPALAPPPRAVGDDPALKAVDLMAQGVPPVEAARTLGEPVARVLAWRRLAKARGVKFPPVRMAAKAGAEAPAPAPAPAAEAPAPAAPATPPADWPIPYAQQGWQAQKITRFSAKAAGISIEAQQAREREVVRRLRDGEYIVQIANEMRLSDSMVSTIKRAALKGGVRLPKLRRGGAAAKAMAARGAPPIRRPPPPPLGEVFPRPAAMSRAGRATVQAAASRRGLTLNAYIEALESIVIHRVEGATVAEICARTGFKASKVYLTLADAKKRGVVFPHPPSLQPAT